MARRSAYPSFAVRSGLLLGSAVLAGVILASAGAFSFALFTDTAQIQNSAFTTDTLNAPTGLTAGGGASITLNWTATTDTYASGHRVFRGTAAGGPYTAIADVTPRTTTTYIDNPTSGTYYYVLRAFFQNWESVNSNEASATGGSDQSTGYHGPSAQAAVTTGSGDNNGFQSNPTYAFSDSAFAADDINSGTGTSTSCADAGKDRHQYYNYSFGIPTGSTINGIQVRLDANVDSTVGSPFMCVELSWDGGASWTAVKTTATLGIAPATFTLGSSSDTWGRIWAAADFSDATFRLRITNVASDNTRDFGLDWAAVQLTYAPPAALVYTGFSSCTAQAAVTSGSGDNNGFQTGAMDACTNDGVFALDTNSGTSSTSTCSDATKDRHLFYNYNFSVTSGSTISGLEVRLDNMVDDTSGTDPAMCLELSWDGGTNWTVANATGILSTFENTLFLGSPTDTWGRTWSATDFSNANFRLRVTNIALTPQRDFSLDWVGVQVAYDPP